jgi:hypothetical protein
VVPRLCTSRLLMGRRLRDIRILQMNQHASWPVTFGMKYLKLKKHKRWALVDNVLIYSLKLLYRNICNCLPNSLFPSSCSIQGLLLQTFIPQTNPEEKYHAN